MTEEELKQVVEKLSGTLLPEIMGTVNTALNGFDKKLRHWEPLIKGKESTSDTEKGTEKVIEKGTENPEMLAITKQLALLKAELDAKTQQEHKSSLRSELVSQLGGTISPSAVSELLVNRVGDKFQRSGNDWLDTEGNDLKSFIDTYLKSDEGQAFVKPTVSVKNSSTSPNPSTSGDKSQDSLVMSFFS